MNARPCPVGQARVVARFALLFIGLCAACEDGADVTLEGKTVVVVLPAQARVPVGDTLRVRATQNGLPCDCVWASSDMSRATVGASGLVRAMTTGSVTVIATSRRDLNAKASILIAVVPP